MTHYFLTLYWLQGTQKTYCLAFNVTMTKLASCPIWASTLIPIFCASFLSKMLICWKPDKFMRSMSELALISIVTEAKSWEFFTHLSFILEWISFMTGREIMWIISFLTAVALSRRGRTKIDGILFDWHGFSIF